MNDFETTLTKLSEESEAIQKKERLLREEQQLFAQKLVGFLKENGLPDDFTIPQLALLAVKKSRQVILA